MAKEEENHGVGMAESKSKHQPHSDVVADYKRALYNVLKLQWNEAECYSMNVMKWMF